MLKAILIAAALLVGLTACNPPAKAATCTVYRDGVLVDVYCAVAVPVVSVIGEIVPTKFALAVYSASEIIANGIILGALVGVLAEEAPSGSFAYRLLRRAVSLAAFTAGFAESSTRRRVRSKASGSRTLGATGRLGEFTVRSV